VDSCTVDQGLFDCFLSRENSGLIVLAENDYYQRGFWHVTTTATTVNLHSRNDK
jgi:hypothetical protein